MSIIFRIDDFLLDWVFQPIVDALSRWWGIGFISLGEFLITGGFVCWFSTIFFNDQFINAFWEGKIAFCAFVLTSWVMAGSIMAYTIFDNIKHARRVQREGFINPLRFYMRVIRITHIMGAIVIWLPSPADDRTYGLIGRSFVVLVVSGLYVMSCNEGPPKQRSRVVAPLETTA